MPNGIESKPTGLRGIFRSTSTPESKTGRRWIKPKTLAKAGGLVLVGTSVAAVGTNEFVTEPRKESLQKAEQTQIDFYAQAKEGGKLLPTTGNIMVIESPANIRKNSAIFDGGTLVKPDNVVAEVKAGEVLVIFNGIAREYGFKWTEFRLRGANWDQKPNNATEFADSILAVRHEELAEQELVTVCNLPGPGDRVATIDTNWVLRRVGDDPGQVAEAFLMDTDQSAVIIGQFGKACKPLG